MTTTQYTRLTLDDFYDDDHTSLVKRSRRFANDNRALIRTLNSTRVEEILKESTIFKQSSWDKLADRLKLTDWRLKEIEDVFNRLKRGIEGWKLDDSVHAETWRKDKMSLLCSTYTERFVALTSFREVFVGRK